MHSLLSRVWLLILFLFVTSHCQWQQKPPANRLVVALSNQAKTLDPTRATDAYGQRLTSLTHSALVKIDDHLEVTGDLSQSWTLKDNTYRFKLKKGIYFHNQKPLETKDLLASFKKYQQPSSVFFGQFSLIQSVHCEYDVNKGGWLEVKLQQFSASFLKDLSALKIVSANDLSNSLQKGRPPQGTGPYMLKKETSQGLTLERHPRYHGAPPASEFLEFKVVRDASTRFYKLYKGEIDLIQSDVPHTKVKVFRNHKDFEVITQAGLSTTYLLLNLRKPPMDKKSFRQSLQASIDVDPILTYKMEGLAESASSLLPRLHPYFLSSPHQKALELSTWLDQQNLKPLILKTSNSFGAMENGRIITHQLRQQGLDIEQKSFEWGTFYQDIKEGRFDLAIMQWVGIVDADLFRTSLHSGMFPPGRNRGYFHNAKFDKWVEKARQEPDLEKRRELYHKVQKLLAEELPIIPLWYEKQVAIINKRVKNYRLSSQADFSGLLNAKKE